ncbi:MAG TPA: DUF58 domain-containing protein [Chitinophagaceae bacterium]|nr:DUF58 domain-containing protein [Chitinophagaceae bacterium]
MLRSFYLHTIVYYIAGAAALLYVTSYFYTALFVLGHVLLVLLVLATGIDCLLLYSQARGIYGRRLVAERLSNGDANKVVLSFQNQYAFPVSATVIDELPFQFQDRNWLRECKIGKEQSATLDYFLFPKQRGEYRFGDINVYVCSPLQLVKRRYVLQAEQVVKVYPSYQQMRRYQLLAASNRLQEAGVKRIRRIGHSMEFEQIKEYVPGDDYRTINWKATGRKHELMVNNYTDERSQQIYCIINKGRVMKMPFDGLTLLDHAINTTLVLSNVAVTRQDKAGLICFAQQVDQFLPADKKPAQMNLLQEALYRQQTNFMEPDFEKLYSVVRNRITHRSLLLLFTNFESLESLQREIPSLKKMARYHLLLVIFFENTEIAKVIDQQASTLEDIYIKTIAEKYAYEKRLMVKELHKNGILSVLTSPDKLTVNTVNKYLEIKNRMSL